MRNLIYKEIKLAWHPVTYIFIFAFPFFVFIPSYPTWVCFVYICSCYPILFLGANKGVQTNDIFYSTLLPVRKKDIVLSRMISLSLILAITATLCGVLSIFASSAHSAMNAAIIADGGEAALDVGMPLSAFFSSLFFVLIAFSAYDFIFIWWFYKTGKGILLPTILGILVVTAILTVFVVILPLSSAEYYAFFCEVSIFRQIIYFLIGLAIYLITHYFTYKVGSKEFEKVDL